MYVTYRWCQGIEQQFLALQKGFHEVIPQHHLRPFDERELELVIGKMNKNYLEMNAYMFWLTWKVHRSPIVFNFSILMKGLFSKLIDHKILKRVI